jgi:hypothetical protein
MAALIRDLEAKKLLDKALIIVTTEFGRCSTAAAGAAIRAAPSPACWLEAA